MMITPSPVLRRLLLCLLVSLGVHAGWFFWEWSRVPVADVAARKAMEISLVSAPMIDEIKTGAEASPEAVARELPRPLAGQARFRPPRVLEAMADLPDPPAVTSPATEPPPPDISPPSESVPVKTPAPPSVDLASKPSPREEGPTFPPVTAPAVGAAHSPPAETVRQAVAPAAGSRDAEPRYRSNPLPNYPYLARQRHWEGVVWLLVTVSAEGEVDDLVLAASSGYGVLDKSAMKTVRRWRFSPAKKAGIPIESQVKVPVRFRLED